MRFSRLSRPSLGVLALFAITVAAHQPANAAKPNPCITDGCGDDVDEWGCCRHVTVTPACPAGKTRTPKTKGRCCYPGQTWSAGRCDGRPDACPGALVPLADTCGPAPIAPTCEGGLVLTPDQAHCCWPGQTWTANSVGSGACVGTPACTGGLIADGTRCVAPACTSGRVHTDDGIHCCYPGQRWENGACEGTPSCPSGHFAVGRECQLEACSQDRERVDGIHCCWRGQTWSGGCHGAPTCPRAYVRSGETCALESCPEGKVRVDGLHCCWPAQVFDPTGATPDARCTGIPACPAGWFIPTDLAAASTEEPCQRGGRVDLAGLPAGAHVTIDGRPYAPGSLIAPGPHRLTASAPGYLDTTRAFGLAAAGTAQLEIHLVRASNPLLPWEITAASIGAAGIITGAICLAVASDKRDTVRSAADGVVVDPTTLTQREAKTLEADANTFADAGAATLVIGGIGLATAATLIVLDLTSGPPTGTAHRIDLVPVAGRGAQGAIIRLGGSF